MLDKGMPNEPRFPERDTEWVNEIEKKQRLLLEWFEDFKAKFGSYKEAADTINDINHILGRYTEVRESVRRPLEVRDARNARKAQGMLRRF